ncbi:MAG: hypothetical protein QXR69_02010 [Conexivisphaerales archaeon]
MLYSCHLLSPSERSLLGEGMKESISIEERSFKQTDRAEATSARAV